MKKLNITKTQLAFALLQWENDARNGKTLSRAEAGDMTAEQVAESAADHLWRLLSDREEASKSPKFRIGDRFVVKKGAMPYFKTGDVGVIVDEDVPDLFWANFSQNERVYGDGMWCVGVSEIEKLDKQAKS